MQILKMKVKAVLVIGVVMSLAMIFCGYSFAFANDYQGEVLNEQKTTIGDESSTIQPNFISINSHTASMGEIVNGKVSAAASFTYYGSDYTASSTIVLERSSNIGWVEVDRSYKSFSSPGLCFHADELSVNGSGTYRVKSYVAIYNGNKLVEQSTLYSY